MKKEYKLLFFYFLIPAAFAIPFVFEVLIYFLVCLLFLPFLFHSPMSVVFLFPNLKINTNLFSNASLVSASSFLFLFFHVLKQQYFPFHVSTLVSSFDLKYFLEILNYFLHFSLSPIKSWDMFRQFIFRG